MVILQGKYNIAKIMVPDDTYIDIETRKQVYSFLNHPAFTGKPIVIMPDTHAGKGAVIGFTMHLNNYVIPNIVGVDIGCGMLMAQLPVVEIDYAAFDNFVTSSIPAGFSLHSGAQHLADVTSLAIPNVLSFTTQCHHLAEKVGQKDGMWLQSIGTLGGGNHFIEIDRDDKGNLWLVVHSGSRNLGLKTCNYHQHKARDLMRTMFIGDAYKSLEFLPMDNGGEEYLLDMLVCQTYASVNRMVIIDKLLKYVCKTYGDIDYSMSFGDSLIECVHNYISPNDHIIRKGAISARAGERVIIPLNMRDGVIVGTGKGNRSWNQSAPHGAGRCLSRSRAKETIDLEDFQAAMDGIWTSSVNQNTIDEAPQAYKDSQMIIDAITESVDVDFVMKPEYNFKASGK